MEGGLGSGIIDRKITGDSHGREQFIRRGCFVLDDRLFGCAGQQGPPEWRLLLESPAVAIHPAGHGEPLDIRFEDDGGNIGAEHREGFVTEGADGNIADRKSGGIEKADPDRLPGLQTLEHHVRQGRIEDRIIGDFNPQGLLISGGTDVDPKGLVLFATAEEGDGIAA